MIHRQRSHTDLQDQSLGLYHNVVLAPQNHLNDYGPFHVYACSSDCRNRKNGADHIWLMTHDEGACYAPNEIWCVQL
jgi:hypothetical protein